MREINNKLIEGINNIYDLIVLNLYWILGFVLGLGIFGFIPSTIAVTNILRNRHLKKDSSISFFNYWKYYKQNFIKNNLYGLFLLGCIYLGFLYIQTLDNLDNVIKGPYIWLTYGIFICFIILNLYILIVYIHFDFSFKMILKHSLVFMITCPIHTLLLILIILISSWTVVRFPLYFPFIQVSLFLFLISKIIFHAINVVTQVQNKRWINK